VEQTERERFSEKWDTFYPKIAKSWVMYWLKLITLFVYPPEMHKVINTKNAIEALTSVIRKAKKQRKVFVIDVSVMKVVYHIMQAASKNRRY